MRGTVILDLRRLNKVLEFDPVLGTCVIEPGCTYRILKDYIEQHNYPFWIDVPGPGPLVGAVGQALERGIGYTAYGDHFGHACGFEVVLADGQVLRTGNASIPGSNTFATTRYGYGPYLNGIFSQSNYGVVTKMGLWLMPKPEVYKPFMVVFHNHDDVAKAVDICQRLKLHNVIKNTPIVGHILYQIAQREKRAEVFKGAGSVTDQWVSDYASARHMGVWAIPAALYGSEAQVAADWALVKEAFKDSGGTVLTDLLLHEDTGWQHAKRQMAGELDLDEFALYNWRGGGGSVWFGITAQAKGTEATKIVKLAKGVMNEFGIDFLGGFMVQAREMIAVFDLLYDRSNPDEMAKAHASASIAPISALWTLRLKRRGRCVAM
jgi:4-cresol dehydrogenase (hydroxylating)